MVIQPIVGSDKKLQTAEHTDMNHSLCHPAGLCSLCCVGQMCIISIIGLFKDGLSAPLNLLPWLRLLSLPLLKREWDFSVYAAIKYSVKKKKRLSAVLWNPLPSKHNAVFKQRSSDTVTVTLYCLSVMSFTTIIAIFHWNKTLGLWSSSIERIKYSGD